MNACDRILEMLPWYVTGKLSASDRAAVAEHVQRCEACRRELAEVVWVQHTVTSETRDLPAFRERVWRSVTTRAGLRDLAQIDIGSLLVGFRLGVSARRPGAPVRANLRVMGRNVRIVGSSRANGGKSKEGSA